MITKPNLTLDNGQVISGLDPNYDSFAKQQKNYIGATNWNNLKTSGKYTDYQLGKATQNIGGNIFWNPDVNIADIPAQLNSTELSGGSTIPAPEKTTPVDIDSLMAGLNTGSEGTRALLEQYNAPLPSQSAKDANLKKQNDYAEENKTAMRDLQEETWNRFNATENIDHLQKLFPQMANTEAQFARMQEELSGSNGLTRIIGGSQDRLARQKAVEMAGLGAMAQAYQGNIELARSMSTDAINAKYKDQEMYLGNLKEQLGAINGDLNREDKARADSLNLVIGERERAIADEKEKEQKINDTVITLAESGAPQDVLQKILKAETYQDALLLAMPYMEEKLSPDMQIKLMDGGYKVDVEGNVVADISSATVDQIADAIKKIESNGDYEAKGASGEYGAYQFMPGTWNSWSREYADKVLQTSIASLEKTPENQDAVAKFKIQQWLDQGLTPEQIAAKWNSGSEVGWENKIGVNNQGVAYNVPSYVNKFKGALSSQLDSNIEKKEKLTPAETQFEKELNAEILKLQKGGKWGVSWEFLMNRYGDAGLTNEQLDDLLDKSKYYEN